MRLGSGQPAEHKEHTDEAKCKVEDEKNRCKRHAVVAFLGPKLHVGGERSACIALLIASQLLNELNGIAVFSPRNGLIECRKIALDQ